MVIVTNGDFSANNVGKIEINKPIAAEVQAIAQTYGGLVSKKLFALQDLYDDLVAGGFWARLKKLYVPMLANDLAHSMVNIKGNAVDWTPSATLYSLNQYGIVAVTDNAADTTSIAFTQTATDLSLFAYTASTAAPQPAVGDGTHIMFLNGFNAFRAHLVTIDTYGLSFRVSSVGGNGMFTDGFKKGDNRGLFMMSAGQNGTAVRLYAYGRNLVPSNGPVATSAITIPNLTPFRDNNNAIRLRIPTGLLGLANDLTFADYQALNVIIDRFKDKLLAA